MPEQSRTYRVEQLGPPRGPRGIQLNDPVSDLKSVVTHHPGANRAIHIRDAQIRGAEDQLPGYTGSDRSYAFIDGEFQEIIDNSTDRYRSLKPDQILMVKDFILEDLSPMPGRDVRAVDVPSPIAGYVSLIRDSGGMVEIMDRQGGSVIARVRHLDPISVREGDTIAYGQSLGTQNKKGLDPKNGKHVHIEMDTGHSQELKNYIGDLVSGRLPVQASFRENIEPQLIVDDGAFRLGESNERICDLQRVMTREGYRAAGDRPLDQDGVYRLGMLGALLDFQRAHGVPQTGDIDPATLNFAPLARTREIDRQDYFMPGRYTPLTPEPPTAPGHPDHRQHLPRALEPAINQHRNRQSSNHADRDADSRGPFNDPFLDRAYAAAINGNSAELDRVGLEFTQSQEGQRMLQWGQELYAQQQLEEQRQLQEQQMTQARHGPVMTR